MSQEQGDITPEQAVFQIVLLSIENDNVVDFIEFANKIPFGDMDRHFSLEGLNKLLETCHLNGRHQLARYLIFIFDDTFENDSSRITDDSVYYQIFGNRLFSDVLVMFMKESFANREAIEENEVITWSEVMDVFAQGDNFAFNNPNMPYACSRVTLVYGEQPYETYQQYHQLALSVNNVTMLGYIETKLQETSVVAPKPDYVVSFGDPPTETFVVDNLPEPTRDNLLTFDITPEEAVRAIQNAPVGTYGEGVEQATFEQLIEAWNKSSIDERRALLLPVLRTLATAKGADNNFKLFRYMGPANPIDDLGLGDDEDPCVKYGCRMLYCNCADAHVPEDDYMYDPEEYDWFLRPGETRSTCDECFDQLINRARAVRIPLVGGGWTGRYCNKTCLLKAQSKREHTEVEPTGRDVLLRQQWEIYFTEIQTIGLQDRIQD